MVYRHFSVVAISVLSVFIFSFAAAWEPVPVEDDPLVRMPGTQPVDGVTLEGPNRCLNCHSDFDPVTEPGFQWQGSMMAQAARDPIFWAAMTVAAQDSIWALGTPNAADLCERCHFPEGWLAGRSDPANASLMTGSDFDGVHCDVCHLAYDPFAAATHGGTREGSDWTGYWDESNLSDTPSQAAADDTLAIDQAEAATTSLFSGGDFHINDLPYSPNYTENAGGQFFISKDPAKRASFADAEAAHQMEYSRYHKSKFFCSSCHDVSNPVLANLGLSGLTDDGSGNLISEQYSASRFFHVERTFSEFMLSAYGQPGGATTNPEFQAQGGANITHAATCQDCHMRDVTGRAANKNKAVYRPDDSIEHPNSGVPSHDLTGGNTWITHILASLDESLPEYDSVNAQLLGQGPAVLTLDLSGGQSPLSTGAELLAAADRARQQLQMAATIQDVAYDVATGDLSFRILNNTGHKLLSGYPEGRRMFMNVQAFDADDNLIYEVNPYDYTVGTLKGQPASPTLSGTETAVDTLVYEAHTKSSLTGEQSTFHFVLADGRSKDNRIPPKGFDVAASVERVSEPVNPVTHTSDLNYFTAAEYAGGYDEQQITIVPQAVRIELSLYYQGTSREYIEFLRDEINGTGIPTLASPTPSGEAEAYVIQSDAFFDQLKAWGDTMWELWWHNHGLDGSGTAVAGIVPVAMAEATYRPPLALNITYPPEAGVKGQFYWWGGLSASGGQPPYTCSLIGGWIPWPMTLDPQTGVIMGIPANAVTAYFTVQVADANSDTATIQSQITVNKSDYDCGATCHSALSF